MKEVLIVDGYNIIGAWPDLAARKQENLEAAREQLIEMLREYQAFSGREVIVVFDAHSADKFQRLPAAKGIEVIFSKELETADDVIERLAYQMIKKRKRVYVATSDLVEQQVTFGEGALRISSNELRVLFLQAKKQIHERVDQMQKSRNTLADSLDGEIAKILENWRRNQ